MLTRVNNRRPARVAGFTLVELMVALVVGLVVIGAVLALIVSIMRANQQTIQATRLTQELRATAELINNEVRRARGVADPLSFAKIPDTNAVKQAIVAVTVSGNCILYAYEGGVGGDFRAIRLNGGKIVVASAATRAAAGCGSTGVELTSNNVVIDSLTFTAPGAPPVDRVRRIEMTITGRLANPASDMGNITRTITQSIFIPSVGAGST